MFTLDAQALVSGHWHKVVLLSDTGCSMHLRVQGRDLVPGNAQGAPILVGELEKRCVHIGAQRESYSGTQCEHSLKETRVYLSYKLVVRIYC